MAALVSIASSGLQAAQLRLQVSAHNIANMNTPGFLPQRVQAQAQAPRAGVSAWVQQGEQPGVVLEEEVVQQLAARSAWRANLYVLRVAQETTGTLLNVRV
ncbi:flagellar basal body protein [Comamonas sp. NLF-1-9]|uniref:flagellar basal body protein n=1 Tax=Comamonas sp. NLF-1-9 TaxID=2853163 RepID=UPI001C48E66D|nr:flagellar basal body protein [Comamonas sp. NLF-1-9]QXL84000.1 flagellar basal body protein [Comamonas sp. NLF-1-9]